MVDIFDQACELLSPWTKELYLCTVAPLSSLWPPPPLPKLNVLFIQTVSVWGGEGGGWIVLYRPYSAGILHSVSDQMQNLPNYFTTPNKMTSENDIKGLVSLKFLRPCFQAFLASPTPSLCLLLTQSTQRMAMATSGVHPIMMVKSAQPGAGGWCTPSPFHSIYCTIMSKVVVYPPEPEFLNF
jgi:hypothetical protein